MPLQTNPVKAIREKCLDCCCWQQKEVELCPVKRCALHPFRFGKNPYRKKVTREFTEEQKAAMRERLNNARKTRTRKDDE